jgi:hypothetical protein
VASRLRRAEHAKVEEGKEAVARQGLKDALRDDQGQVGNAHPAKALVSGAALHHLHRAHGHEPVRDSGKPAKARGRQFRSGKKRCKQASSPGGQQVEAALPGRFLLEARMQDEKSAGIEEQVVPRHMNERMGEEAPPLAALEIVGAKNEGRGRQAWNQMQVEEKKDRGKKPRRSCFGGDHGPSPGKEKGRDGSFGRHPPSAFSGCLSLLSK